MRHQEAIRTAMTELNDIQITKLTAEVKSVLKRYEYTPLCIILSCVSELCEVPEADILTTHDVQPVTQARWLFWYSYRYLTGDSYETIARRTSVNGHGFSMRSVAGGVTAMGELIQSNDNWRRRWAALKNLISEIGNTTPREQQATIEISKPKNVKINIKNV